MRDLHSSHFSIQLIIATMGLFRWLFGKHPPVRGVSGSEISKRCSPEEPVKPLDLWTTPPSEFIEIPDRKFFGQCVRSPNRRYTLAWRDANESGSAGGHRSTGKGRYYLLDGKKIISTGSIARPNDGKVADNGTFVFNDWGLGEGLQGTFLAFDKAGVKLYGRRFKANLFNNGLSPTGEVAVCQTCNSYDSDDGSILTIFDLDTRVEIAHWIPLSGWADYYSFGQSGVIQLGYARFGAFAYSWSGDFIDKERWQEVRLESGSYGEVMMLIEQLLKASPSSHDLERLVRSIDRIEPTIPTLETKSRAQAKKLRGLCLEAQSDLENALRLYEDALNLDPKIGLKRRIAQLHKLLRTNDPSLKMEGK